MKKKILWWVGIWEEILSICISSPIYNLNKISLHNCHIPRFLKAYQHSNNNIMMMTMIITKLDFVRHGLMKINDILYVCSNSKVLKARWALKTSERAYDLINRFEFSF